LRFLGYFCSLRASQRGGSSSLKRAKFPHWYSTWSKAIHSLKGGKQQENVLATQMPMVIGPLGSHFCSPRGLRRHLRSHQRPQGDLLGSPWAVLGCSWGALGSLGALWGRSWVALVVLLGALGSLLGALGSLLGRSWVALGSVLGSPRCSWVTLGCSWVTLGLLLGTLGCSWIALGVLLGALGVSWGALGASWGALGSPWVALGVLLGPLWVLLGLLGELLGLLGSLLGCSWGFLGNPWGFSGYSWDALESRKAQRHTGRPRETQLDAETNRETQRDPFVRTWSLHSPMDFLFRIPTALSVFSYSGFRVCGGCLL
jgi:hypothetical protein